MGLKSLLAERGRLETDIKWVQGQLADFNEKLAAVNEDIETIIAGPVKESRRLAGKDTGTVDVLIDGVMVKHCVQKKVVWDQEKLIEVRKRILAGNDNPDKYMDSKTTYKVSEKAFKAMVAPVKKIFATARTVMGGTPKITFDTDWR